MEVPLRCPWLWRSDFSRTFQHCLDRWMPHPVGRWLGTLGAAGIYMLRVYFVQGFYIVSYGIGISVLNLLIGFLSPMVDPELEALDGALMPTRGSDEFKPFIRRLPEFKFWYSITKAFCVAFVMTFFSIFDVPVFWPILLFYWMWIMEPILLITTFFSPKRCLPSLAWRSPADKISSPFSALRQLPSHPKFQPLSLSDK